MEQNLDKINWKLLSSNPNAINLLSANLDKIDWEELSNNKNAIQLLKEKIENEKKLSVNVYNKLKKFQKINWNFLSGNQGAIKLLEENIDKIDWKRLSKNPSIFIDEPMPIV